MHTARYTRQLQQVLPAGAEVYLFDPAGTIHILTRSNLQLLDPLQCAADRSAFLRFIDEGHFARYFIGSAATSEQNPTNATGKVGMMRPHSAFTPHAHGTEHFVLSLGYASCGLYDQQTEQVVNVRLLPGTLLRIPQMMPHSFNNRAADPLHLVIANTGMGLEHEEYAITADQAERYARQPAVAPPVPVLAGHDHVHHHDHTHTHMHIEPTEALHHAAHDVDYTELARALRRLEQEMPRATLHTTLTWRERIAAMLRKLAWTLEQH